jgi:hypothetical protein
MPSVPGRNAFTLCFLLSGCATNSAVGETCVQEPTTWCFGPQPQTLKERDLRLLKGQLPVACNGVVTIDANYTEQCKTDLKQLHAALAAKWAGAIEFASISDEDFKRGGFCVDAVDKGTGEMLGGPCIEYIKVNWHFEWIASATPNNPLDRSRPR